MTSTLPERVPHLACTCVIDASPLPHPISILTHVGCLQNKHHHAGALTPVLNALSHCGLGKKPPRVPVCAQSANWLNLSPATPWGHRGMPHEFPTDAAHTSFIQPRVHRLTGLNHNNNGLPFFCSPQSLHIWAGNPNTAVSTYTAHSRR